MINKILNNKYELILKENLLHIKNYKEIIDINSNNIIIKLNNKTLKIKGNDLLICCLDEYEILIKGNIKGLDFNE